MALLAACFLCACDGGGHAAGPSKPCAGNEENLANIKAAAVEFSDIPLDTDAKAHTYFVQAAKLAVLQGDLHVEQMTVQDFAALAKDPLHFGHLDIDSQTAQSLKQRSEERAKDLESKIETVLKAADDNGLSLRDGKGGAVDAERIMRATFWREAAAKAQSFLDSCSAGGSGVSASDVKSFVADLQLIEVADVHELMLHDRIAQYLATEGK